MKLWMLAAIALGVIGIALLVAGAARRNRDGRRLCPRCRYDLTATARPPCSECGYAWANDAELLSKPASRWQRITGAFALVLALGIVLSLPWLTGRHWVHFVPQPLLMAALNLLVDEPPIAPGAQLPAPDLALRDSQNLWERLVWQQQVALAIERFLDMVEKSGGSLEDIERLVPIAIEANGLYRQYGSFGGWPLKADLWPWEDSRPVALLTKRVRSRRAELDARSALPLGTWAAAELQYFAGNSDTYPNWIAPPLEVHLLLSESNDPVVRRYALARLYFLRGPEATAALESLATDPDPTIRAEAASSLLWRREFRGWKE